MTHSSVLLLTLLSSGFILLKQEAHVRTKGHPRHDLVCHSHSLFYWSCAQQLTDSQRDKEACYFLYSRSLWEKHINLAFSFSIPPECPKKQQNMTRVILKYLSGQNWYVWLPASLFTECSSTLTSEKLSSFSKVIVVSSSLVLAGGAFTATELNVSGGLSVKFG